VSFPSLAGARIPHSARKTLLLLHFEGNFTDATGRHGTLTELGAQGPVPDPTFTPTAQFGSTAWEYLAENGIETSLTDPLVSDFEFGTGDWTAEGWFRRGNTTDVRSMLLTMQMLDEFSNAEKLWGISIDRSGKNSTIGTLGVRIFGADFTFPGDFTHTFDEQGYFTFDVFRHWAVVMKAGVLSAYIDGTLLASLPTAAVMTAAGATAVGVSTYTIDNLVVGGVSNGSALIGSKILDEVRISNVARYDGPFTPPVAAFVVD
jgi:hypothetical protein